MEKAFEMGKSSARGSFHLLIGVVTSTVIMAVGGIVLTRLMSPAEYGLYGVALIPSHMMMLFRDWGGQLGDDKVYPLHITLHQAKSSQHFNSF